MAKIRQVKFYEDDHVTIRTTVTIIEEDDGSSHFICPEGHTMYAMELEGIEPKMYKAYGYDPALIKPWTVGNRTRIAYLVPVRDIEYKALVADEKAEQKREERKSKCLVPGKNGRPIVCRETCCRKAYEDGRCKRYGRTDNTTARDLYIEDIKKSNPNWEPSTGDTTASAANAHMDHEDIKKQLAAKQPKLPIIYEEYVYGLSTREIAARHGFNYNTTNKDLRRIKNDAAEILNYDLKEIKGKGKSKKKKKNH